MEKLFSMLKLNKNKQTKEIQINKEFTIYFDQSNIYIS